MFLFFQQWRAECLKLLARKRTYLGFGAFLALEAAVLALVHIKGANHFKTLITRQGQVFDEYYSAPTLALILLTGVLMALQMPKYRRLVVMSAAAGMAVFVLLVLVA